MSGAMNRHCIPGLTMSTATAGASLQGVSGMTKRCTQGLARTYCIMPTPRGEATEETGHYDLAWKDLCSVLE